MQTRAMVRPRNPTRHGTYCFREVSSYPLVRLSLSLSLYQVWNGVTTQDRWSYKQWATFESSVFTILIVIVSGRHVKVDRDHFLADRINGRAIGRVLRLSSSSLCDVKYCG